MTYHSTREDASGEITGIGTFSQSTRQLLANHVYDGEDQVLVVLGTASESGDTLSLQWVELVEVGKDPEENLQTAAALMVLTRQED